MAFSGVSAKHAYSYVYCMSMYGLICVGVHGIAMSAFMTLQCRFASLMWREDIHLWIMYIQVDLSAERIIREKIESVTSKY